MAGTSRFYEQCEQLFAVKLGYGRRWKTSAAQALGIGRATLYRYFDNDSAVAPDVRTRLAALEGDARPTRNDREMVTLFARGLLDLQELIDRHGWIRNGFPASLQRSFDLASARNALEGGERWPTDLASLSILAEKPLFDWVDDVSWDPEGDFTAAALIADGEVTAECIDLAIPGKDPETELVENAGFGLLRSICHERPDGQDVYAAFRRAVITHPVLSNWTATILADAVLSSVEGIDEVVDTFYQRVPEALTIAGKLPICRISGTILRKWRQGFHTESREPHAIRLARAGDYDPLPWRPGTMQLRRAFRLYWCLPGVAEIALENRLTAAGWTCTLWPKLDRVDLAAVSPDGTRRIAVDVKDYLSPETLAARFGGFKDYSADHDCFLVVPDYMSEISSGYVRKFEAVRASYGKVPVALRTVSELVADLGTGT